MINLFFKDLFNPVGSSAELFLHACVPLSWWYQHQDIQVASATYVRGQLSQQIELFGTPARFIECLCGYISDCYSGTSAQQTNEISLPMVANSFIRPA